MGAVALEAVRSRIAAAAVASGRDPSGITVVAVSKGRTIDDIMELYRAGHRDFGENRSHELVGKVEELPDDIVWHFVGSLQSRKTRDVIGRARWLHSLDRLSLVEALVRRGGDLPTCLVQVNVAGEPQKSGCAPEEAADLVTAARDAGVDVAGLMVIPPLAADPEANRPWFRRLVELRDAIATPETPLAVLSMGMTDDFEVAVAEGATAVRIGRAIFEPGDH